jgi:hypothetical protein
LCEPVSLRVAIATSGDAVRGQNTTKKSQSCAKFVKLPIKKLLVFFFPRQGLPDNPCFAKKILIININSVCTNLYY